MHFAVFSALSLICVDAAGLAAPLAADETAQETPAARVVAQEDRQTLAAPPVEILEDANLKVAPRAFADDEAFEGAPAFQDESDEAVLERLSAYLENLDTLKGDFTQIAPSGAISTGRIYLRRPGLLRFEYDPPTPLLIVANGGMVYVRDEALETTDSYPVGRTPLKYLLRKRVNFLKLNPIAIERGADTLAATFASDKDNAEGELTIIVNAPELTLSRWIVRDLEHGVTVVTLDNVEEGIKLANRLFETPDAGGRFLKN